MNAVCDIDITLHAEKKNDMKDKIESDNNTQTYSRVKERALDNARTYIDKRFDRDRRMRRLNRYETDFAEHVFSLAGANSHFMDAPCGSGRFFKLFSQSKRLTMVDLSPAMLQVAKETAEGLGDLRHVQFIEADIKAVPMPNDSVS